MSVESNTGQGPDRHISRGVIPITRVQADHLYEIEEDGFECPGCVSIQAPRVWWKSFGTGGGFYTFCQKCYHEGRLTAPDGKEFEPDELEPAYVSGHQCTCDGDDRTRVNKIIRDDCWVGIHHIETKVGETESHWLMDERIHDVGDACESFEGVVYVPDVLPTISVQVGYPVEDNNLMNKLVRNIVVADGTVRRATRTVEKGFGEQVIRDLPNGEYTIRIQFFEPTTMALHTQIEIPIKRMSKKPMMLGDSAELPEQIEI